MDCFTVICTYVNCNYNLEVFFFIINVYQSIMEHNVKPVTRRNQSPRVRKFRLVVFNYDVTLFVKSLFLMILVVIFSFITEKYELLQKIISSLVYCFVLLFFYF